MWWHGLLPGTRNLKHIEEMTGGAVPAALALVSAASPAEEPTGTDGD